MRNAPEQHRELEPSEIEVSKTAIEMGRLVALMREEKDMHGLRVQESGDHYVITVQEGGEGTIDDMGRMAHVLNENEIDFTATENVMDQMREVTAGIRERFLNWIKKAA